MALHKWRYVYDPLDRVTASYETIGTGSESLYTAHRYDALNNQTRDTYVDNTYYAYTFDAAQQLKTYEAFNASGVTYGTTYAGSFGYDANGSMTTKTGGDGSSRTLGYDVLGRMISAAQNGQATQTYVYDHADRRIGKTVAGTSGYTLNYLYNGPDIHAGYLSNWTTASYVYTHGPGDDNLLMTQAVGQPATYNHADGLGSVVMQTAASTGGPYAIYAVQRYDLWGNITDAPQAGSISSFAFTGRERDETGLYYYRSRYYYPGFERFIQRDPLGLAAGINPYAYVGNNPVNYRDPSGMMMAPAFKLLNTNDLTAAKDYTVGSDMSGGLEAGEQSLSMVLACAPACAGVLPLVPPGGGVSAVPGFPGQVQKNPDAGGYEAALGLPSNTPPSTSWIRRTVDFILDQPGLFIQNWHDLIFNNEVDLSSTKYPESAQHIQDAIGAGQPSELTVGDPKDIPKRRAEALSGYPTIPGSQRDEYPPAWSAEGGKGASVRYISPSDNMGSGAAIGNQLRGLSPGDKVIIRINP